MVQSVEKGEVFGLIRPNTDAHTLGVSTVGRLIKDCGFEVEIGNFRIANAVASINSLDSISFLGQWINKHKISRLGFSYRLDPKDAQFNFGKVFYLLREYRHFREQGGQLVQIYFSGLPEACEQITLEYGGEVPVFRGDETLLETAKKLGIPEFYIPNKIVENSSYDRERMSFAKQLIGKGDYKFLGPIDKFVYPNYGTRNDSLVERIRNNRRSPFVPLMRAHVGPYNSDYEEAKKEFKAWLKTLANTRYLDIISIGSSQLSQSNFGEEWGNRPNGGGVPFNSENDLYEIYEASRPMLVRTYAGTKNIPQLAKIYEKTINIAWHALSFWWFNQIDGRGPNTVKKNLEEHLETLSFIAETNKPFEPNIPHHFAFRGADDYSCVLSSYLAAKTAKNLGVKKFILQVMLNTPKQLFGVQDLAKARAMLMLIRELEDDNFTVFLQARAGLDYFSPDFEKAKVQLAAVTAMMDDIEPENNFSPDIIHVVSYCEAVKLATPEFINESIQITTKSLFEYRRQKKLGLMDDMKDNSEVNKRTLELYNEVKSVVALIEKNISDPYSPEGLYKIFKKGIMPVPYLWEGREEFAEAIAWNTSLINGSMKVVNEFDQPIKPTLRVKEIFMK